MISADLAILLVITAALYFVIGAFWYSPYCLGKPWMKAVGMTSDMSDPNHKMIQAMIISYLVSLAQVFVLALIISHLKVQSIVYSAILGSFMALVFGLLSAVRSHGYIKRNRTQMVIDHGYDVVASAICSAVIALHLFG